MEKSIGADMWTLEGFCGLLLLLLANRVVVSSYPLHSVVSLIAAFVAMSIIWIANGAEFLGLALIFVYVGAVMTLFLFMVMMLNQTQYEEQERIGPWLGGGLGVLSAGCYLLFWLFYGSGTWQEWDWPPPMHPSWQRGSDAAMLGKVLYDDFAWPFTLVGLTLLVAVVVCVGLVFRGKQGRKSQKISAQIATDPKQRIRLVDIGAKEKRR